jgi:hypothetical protein
VSPAGGGGGGLPPPQPDWGAIYHGLLQEPYRFTLADLAEMTDEQMVGIFSKDRPLRRARPAGPTYDGLSFREGFVHDVMAEQGLTREQAEALFVRAFPDHRGGGG